LSTLGREALLAELNVHWQTKSGSKLSNKDNVWKLFFAKLGTDQEDLNIQIVTREQQVLFGRGEPIFRLGTNMDSRSKTELLLKKIAEILTEARELLANDVFPGITSLEDLIDHFWEPTAERDSLDRPYIKEFRKEVQLYCCGTQMDEPKKEAIDEALKTKGITTGSGERLKLKKREGSEVSEDQVQLLKLCCVVQEFTSLDQEKTRLGSYFDQTEKLDQICKIEASLTGRHFATYCNTRELPKTKSRLFCESN
jgi:hypothetical protein